MKDKIKFIGPYVISALLLLTTFMFYLLTEDVKQLSDAQYEIVISDSISVYYGDKNIITPYLINNKGLLEKSRFSYTSNSDNLEINSDGEITISSLSATEVIVTIVEINTETIKDITITIIADIESVLGIIAPDGSLISDHYDLNLGNVFDIQVVTMPENVDIGKYTTVKSYSIDGVQKDAFNITLIDGAFNFEAVGLGDGLINISVINDYDEIIYDNNVTFSISTDNSNLSDAILRFENQTLISYDEISAIEVAYIDNAVTTISGLEYLENLTTVVCEGNPWAIKDLSEQYCYRVEGTYYQEFISHLSWNNYTDNIIPYDGSLNFEDAYVVYYLYDNLYEYALIDNNYTLPIYTNNAGYINSGWATSDNTDVYNSDIRSIQINGIVIYAKWTPIEYIIIYNIIESNESYTEKWNYEKTSSLKEIDDFSTYEIEGYKLAGWSISANGDAITYELGITYSALTTTDNETIYLYAVWEPIEYTISYNLPNGADEIDDITIKYDEQYQLPTPIYTGFTFVNWTTGTGNVVTSVKNLTSIEGNTVIISASFTENYYTVYFDYDGGSTSSYLQENSPYVLAYTSSTLLPTLMQTSYESYYWDVKVDSDANGYTDTSFTIPSSTSTISQLCALDGAVVYLCAVWTAASYTVEFDFNGGVNSLGASSSTNVVYATDSAIFPALIRDGYTFNYWLDESTSKQYTGTSAVKLSTEGNVAIQLIAVWTINTYKISITSLNTAVTIICNDETITNGSYVNYGSILTITYSANTGYALQSFTYETNSKTISIISGSTVTVGSDDIQFYGESTIKTYTIDFDFSNADVNITIDGNTVRYCGAETVYVEYNQLVYIEIEYTEDDSRSWSISPSVVYVIGGTSYTYASFYMPDYNITISASSSNCIAEGSLITLADGAQVAVEDLTGDEMLLVWNLLTGEFDTAPILFIDSDPTQDYQVINLYFSDGTVVKVIYEHAFYSVGQNEYVFLDSTASEYIGDYFIKQSYDEFGNMITTQVELIDVVLTTEETTAYSPVTYEYLCYFVDGMLSMPGGTQGLINIFDVDLKTLTIDYDKMQEDIETYGLFTYEEFYAIYPVSEEIFEAFNGQYLKVSIGKGLITYETLGTLIESYAEFF